MPQPTGTAPDRLVFEGAGAQTASRAASRMDAPIRPDLAQVPPSA